MVAVLDLVSVLEWAEGSAEVLDWGWALESVSALDLEHQVLGLEWAVRHLEQWVVGWDLVLAEALGWE